MSSYNCHMLSKHMYGHRAHAEALKVPEVLIIKKTHGPEDHNGRRQKLLEKQALHIQMIPSEERFNRDGGLKVPGCWTAVMRKQRGRSNPHQPLTSNDVHPQ